MKTYETAKEVVDCLVDFHYRALRLVEEGMDKEQDERVTMLLHYLFEHHSELQEALVNYDADSDDDLFGTPVVYALENEEAPEAFVEEFEVDQHMDFDTAEKLGRALGDYPVDLLANVVAEINEPALAEVFASFLDLERIEQRKLTRALNAMRDM